MALKCCVYKLKKVGKFGIISNTNGFHFINEKRYSKYCSAFG